MDKEREIGPPLPAGIAADCSLAHMEKLTIRRALRIARGNKSQAAKLLGLSRASLYRKLHKYGLEKESAQADVDEPEV